MSDGPPWTVLSERKLPNGRVEVVVRQTGGREVRVRMTALAVALGQRDECIEAVLASLRPMPGPYT